MNLSLGFPNDPNEPYPAPMRQARTRVLAACRAANVEYLDVVRPDNVTRLIDERVRVG